MAAQTLLRLGRALAAVLAGIALAFLLFALAAWVGSSIPRNANWQEPERGITIMVETNGTHTGVVMPVSNAIKDWRTVFPSAVTANGGRTTHVSVGWGEREVFLNVPTWGDLAPLTALRIATTGGDSVMRVSHYVRPAPSEYYRPLRITREQYAQLARRIEAQLVPPGPDGTRERLEGTEPGDAYYEAKGRYTLRRTCNTWVGEVLAEAGIRMGWWTPFAGGVMKWIEPPETTASAT